MMRMEAWEYTMKSIKNCTVRFEKQKQCLRVKLLLRLNGRKLKMEISVPINGVMDRLSYFSLVEQDLLHPVVCSLTTSIKSITWGTLPNKALKKFGKAISTGMLYTNLLRKGSMRKQCAEASACNTV